MKKNILKMMVFVAMMASCTDDDQVIIPEAAAPEETPEMTEEMMEEMMSNVDNIILNEVQYGNRNLVEILNTGTETIDLRDFWLCLGPGEYSQIGGITPESGFIELAGGEFVVLPFEMPDDQGGLGLYSPTVQLNSFSIEYDGEGNASTDWSQEVNPSLGASNDVVAATTTFNVTISNVTNYLAAHPFTTPVGETSPRRLLAVGEQYQIEFQAVPGTKFTPTTMMFNSNDWLLAHGQALNGVDIADQLSLYDAGTEADNDPSNFPPAGPNTGPEDANNLVRLVEGRTTTASDYISAVLDYVPGNGVSAGTFTFTITAKTAALMPFGQDNGFGITPGIVVLHVLPEPLFTLGEPDRGVGLEEIAENGNPMVLYNWLTEAGEQGAPLRLSSSLSVFSPGLVYAFNTDRDPLNFQGEVNNPNNGLEELAEDGVNSVAVDYVAGLGLPVAASNETVNQGPGSDLTFTLEVPQGQNYKFGFATMFVQTNDWFIAYNNAGFPLWDENGVPASGFGASDKSYLYDAGTEVDEAVGFGIYQAPRQGSFNEGPEDANNIIRRVGELEDVQFGKGLITSGPGVVYLEDPRGGYNVIRVAIQPQ